MRHYAPYRPAFDGPGTGGLPFRRQRDLEASGRDPDFPARDAAFWAGSEAAWQAQLDEPGADVAAILERKAGIAELVAKGKAAQAQDAQRMAQHGPELLAEVRRSAPDDPYGGHRPLWLFPYGMACLDCDWVVTRTSFYYGAPASAMREHRSLHLDPPAANLCEWEPLPAWPYRPFDSSLPAPEDDVAWPLPADAIYRSEHDYHHVCADCLVALTEDGDSYTPPRRPA